MDINLLVISIGNSRTAVGAFVAGELSKVARVSTGDGAGLRVAVEEAWAVIKGLEEPAVAGASVVPGAVLDLERVVREATGQGVEWVGKDLDLPLKVVTDEPGKTGVDRVVGLAAAYEQMEKACVVVDAGTAVTINVCSDKGEFLGGVIAPGVRLQLGALSKGTAVLPEVLPKKPEGYFGANTHDAMVHGVYFGIRGLVKEVAENVATANGIWPEIIATGGDAEFLFEGWELIHAVSPDLVLYGVALAYTNHYLKHE